MNGSEIFRQNHRLVWWCGKDWGNFSNAWCLKKKCSFMTDCGQPSFVSPRTVPGPRQSKQLLRTADARSSETAPSHLFQCKSPQKTLLCAKCLGCMLGPHLWFFPSRSAAGAVVRIGLHLSLHPSHGRKIQPCLYGRETCSQLSHYTSPQLSALTLLFGHSGCGQIFPCTESTRILWFPNTVKCSSCFYCTSKTYLKPCAFCF